MSKIERKLIPTTEKLQEIHESVSKTIIGVEEKVLKLEKTVDTKVIDFSKTVDGKLVIIQEKINNLQSQRPELVLIGWEGTGRINTPCFDGSSHISVFKFQFETVVSRNGWDDGKMLRN